MIILSFIFLSAILSELNRWGELEGLTTKMQEPVPGYAVLAITIRRLASGKSRAKQTDPVNQLYEAGKATNVYTLFGHIKLFLDVLYNIALIR